MPDTTNLEVTKLKRFVARIFLMRSMVGNKTLNEVKTFMIENIKYTKLLIIG